VRERTLYFFLSFTLSQFRDFRIGIIIMKFRSFGDCTSSRVEDKLKTISLSILRVNGHSRSLVRLPVTLFRLDYTKLSIRLLLGKI